MLYTQSDIEKRVNKLFNDKQYINQLVADIFDAECNDHIITPSDVTRITNTITSTSYLFDIAEAQLAAEHTYAIPHGYINPQHLQLI
jgi:hypothetical protein